MLNKMVETRGLIFHNRKSNDRFFSVSHFNYLTIASYNNSSSSLTLGLLFYLPILEEAVSLKIKENRLRRRQAYYSTQEATWLSILIESYLQ